MRLVPRLDQLTGDAHAVAITANASLEDAIDLQLLGNLSNGFLGGLVLDGGSSRDPPRPLGAELPGMGDYFRGLAIRKKVLSAITIHISQAKAEQPSLCRASGLPGW